MRWLAPLGLAMLFVACADVGCPPGACGAECGDCPQDQLCSDAGLCSEPEGPGPGPVACPAECPDACDSFGQCFRPGDCPAECPGRCNADGQCPPMVSCPAECPDNCGADGACPAEPCTDRCNAPGTGVCDAEGLARLCLRDPGHGADCTRYTPPIPCGEGRQCLDGRCGGACIEPSVMLLVDRTADVAAPFVRDALLAFSERHGTRLRFGLRAFPDDVDACSAGSPVAPSADGRLVLARLGMPLSTQQTAVTAAFTDLARSFGGAADGQAAILLIGGRPDCGPIEALADQVATLRAAGVTTYAIGVGEAVDGQRLARIAREADTLPAAGGLPLAIDGPTLERALLDVLTRLDACLCRPGTYACEGNNRVVCADSGTAYEQVERCEHGCREGIGECYPLCHPDEDGPGCVGDALAICGPDGASYVPGMQCPLGCFEGLGCRLCPPFDSYCENGELFVCAPDRMSYERRGRC
ncbi:MAG: hypothetical protein KC620_18210 [Myxococcales bacterium]|nr:hypothetical protein [Myxococcales bacterium]